MQAQQTSATGSAPYRVKAVDLNGDGKLDLVVPNFLGDSVSTLLGKGDGTFQTQQTFALGSRPLDFELSDLTGDGKLDLATANRGNQTVSVLLGKGDGTFQNQQVYSFTFGDEDITTADVEPVVIVRPHHWHRQPMPRVICGGARLARTRDLSIYEQSSAQRCQSKV